MKEVLIGIAVGCALGFVFGFCWECLRRTRAAHAEERREMAQRRALALAVLEQQHAGRLAKPRGHQHIP
jgi:hypothetical protein